MTPPHIRLDELPHRFRHGERVYLQGASGEVRALRAVFSSDPQPLDGVVLTGGLLPGLNSFDYAALHPGARAELFLAAPHLRTSLADGRTRILPLSYSQIAAHFTVRPPDLAVLTVTPPQAGFVSFGACADFGPIVAAGARRRLGVVNAAMPRPLTSPRLPVEAFEALCEVHEAFDAADAPPSGALEAIGRRVADLVPDEAAIEIGIGAAPAAVWACLTAHRGLQIFSGMVTDGLLAAVDAGAAAPKGHVAGVAWGSAALAKRLDRSDLVVFADVTVTHDVARLGSLPRFTAINSALEVDLYGQANLEWLDGRPVSGVGGAPDFGGAAQLSRGGRSILALPSTAKGGSVSRIRVRLQEPASLSRTAVDTVVTEYGVASLRGKSVEERAQALLGIAAPQHRDALADAWVRGQA